MLGCDEDVFPVDIAAKRICRLVGQDFSVRDLLEAATRGEIGVGVRVDDEIGWLGRNDLEAFMEIASRSKNEFDPLVFIGEARMDVDEAKKFNAPGSLGCYADDPLKGIERLHQYVALKDLLVTDGEAIWLTNSILCLHKKEDQTASLRNGQLYRGVVPVELMSCLKPIPKVRGQEALKAYVDAYLDISLVYFEKCEDEPHLKHSREACAGRVLKDYQTIGSGRKNDVLKSRTNAKEFGKQATKVAVVNGCNGWPPQRRPTI